MPASIWNKYAKESPVAGRWCGMSCLAALILASATAWGDVVVIANRLEQPVRFLTFRGSADSQLHTVVEGDLLVMPTAGQLRIAYQLGGQRRDHRLDPNRAFAFEQEEGGAVALRCIPAGGTPHTQAGTGIAKAGTLDDFTTLTLKILADEDERATRARWEARLRKRVAAASEILEKYCRVRLQVVATEQWQSDNRLKEFEKSLAEFESEVRPGSADLAVGFTSQYEIPQGRTHLGGTRGPFHRHILIREWSQHITEAERLEVLVHELGHVLGAAHSADANSVMRPMLGDRKARSIAFRIGFDPPNTLAMNLISQEMRLRGTRQWTDLSPSTIRRLIEIYTALQKSLPNDISAKKYTSLLRRANLLAMAPGARQVVQALQAAARSNAVPASADAAARHAEQRREGDSLTSFYVRRAAWAARELDEAEGALQFLSGLGVAVNDSTLLDHHPQLKLLSAAVETPQERAARRALWGKPSMHGRTDLTKHFIVSAYLTAVLGKEAAQTASLAKEALDIQRGGGFSFADLAADYAGIAFAEGVLSGRITLDHVASEFSVEDYMPPVTGLPENIGLTRFLAEFGSPADARFAEVTKDIRARITALPPYRDQLRSPQKLMP